MRDPTRKRLRAVDGGNGGEEPLSRNERRELREALHWKRTVWDNFPAVALRAMELGLIQLGLEPAQLRGLLAEALTRREALAVPDGMDDDPGGR